MAAWWDGAALFLEFSPTTNPLDTPTWVDITDRMRRPVTISRGKSDEDADIAPGRMTVILSNPDRHFDPEYSSGPYFGNLKPMRRIRLRATVSAFSTTVFDGFVTAWGQRWGDFDGSAVLSCIDGSWLFRNTPLCRNAYEGHVLADAPDHYWPMQSLTFVEDRAGSLTLGIEPLNTLTGPTTPIETTATAPVDAELMLFKGTAIGPYGGAPIKAIEFWALLGDPFDDAIYSVNASNGTSSIKAQSSENTLLVTYANATDNRWTLSSLTTMPGAGLFHIGVYADTTNIYTYVDGVLRTTTALSVGPGSPDEAGLRFSASRVDAATGGVSHVAIYATAPSPSRWASRYAVAWHGYGFPVADTTGTRIGRILDEVGWPAGRRSISTGNTTHRRYIPDEHDAMTELRDLERAEQGMVFFDVDGNLVFRDRQWLWTQAESGVVLSDDGAVGAIEYAAMDPSGNDVDTVRNSVTVTFAQVGAITNRDQASIAAHFTAEETLDCPTLPDGGAASLLGQYRVRLRKDPQTLFPEAEIDMRPALTTQMPAVLGLEIGDLVTVERTPMNVGSQIVKKALVYGIEHEIHDDQWTTRLYLSAPVLTAANAPYLTLGDANRGKLGTTAGNLLPY